MIEAFDPDRFYEYPQISEGNFVNNYLPLLLKADDVEGAREKWLNDVAKFPFSYVAVVDNNDHEKFLYWVPPLMYGPDLRTGNMINAVENAREQTLITGDLEKLNSTIKQLEPYAQAAEPPQDHIDQWEMILKRYGLLEGKVTSVPEVKIEDADEEHW